MKCKISKAMCIVPLLYVPSSSPYIHSTPSTLVLTTPSPPLPPALPHPHPILAKNKNTHPQQDTTKQPPIPPEHPIQPTLPHHPIPHRSTLIPPQTPLVIQPLTWNPALHQPHLNPYPAQRPARRLGPIIAISSRHRALFSPFLAYPAASAGEGVAGFPPDGDGTGHLPAHHPLTPFLPLSHKLWPPVQLGWQLHTCPPRARPRPQQPRLLEKTQPKHVDGFAEHHGLLVLSQYIYLGRHSRCTRLPAMAPSFAFLLLVIALVHVLVLGPGRIVQWRGWLSDPDTERAGCRLVFVEGKRASTAACPSRDVFEDTDGA